VPRHVLCFLERSAAVDNEVDVGCPERVEVNLATGAVLLDPREFQIALENLNGIPRDLTLRATSPVYWRPLGGDSGRKCQHMAAENVSTRPTRCSAPLATRQVG